MPVPRPRNTDARRAEITAGLLQVLGERGYAGASIQRIAAAADLTPGLVHYHFRSKVEILVALVRQLADGVEARFRARVEGLTLPWDRVDAFLDAQLAVEEQGDARHVGAWIVTGAEALRDADVAAVWREVCGRRLALAEELLSAAMPGAEVTAHAAALVATVDGLLLQHLTNPGAMPPGQAAAVVRRFARSLESP